MCGLGIIGACYIAESLNIITSALTNRIKSLLKRMKVLRHINDCDKDRILYYIMHDKKVVNEKIIFILPIKIGFVRKYVVSDTNFIKHALDKLMKDVSNDLVLNV